MYLLKGRFHLDPDKRVFAFTQSLDIDWRLFIWDIEGSIAHVRMLGHVGIISEQEAKQIENALKEIRQEIRTGKLVPDLSLEDIHMNIEARLIEKIGDVGAKLHTARSRNDQICTDVRLYLKDQLNKLKKKLKTLLETLIELAERDINIIIPGYTHLQQAQLISAGHYWMAYFWKFLRDYKKLEFAYESTDENPLGCGALAGTTLPIDREFTREELGFSKNTENSLDTISTRDFMLDYHYFASCFMMHASRLAEDLIIYSTSEFGFVDISERYCTTSSMMPQKKNPDVLELIRGRTSQVYGHFFDLLVLLKGLPLTYNRDMQEDKRGLWNSLDVVDIVLSILPDLLKEVKIDQERALKHVENGFILATDIAEYLVLKGVPFRNAHKIVGKIVKDCINSQKRIFDLSLEDWKSYSPYFEEDIFDILSFEASVKRRKSYGGTAPTEVKRQINKAKSILKEF